jgi:hypothetical protein
MMILIFSALAAVACWQKGAEQNQQQEPIILHVRFVVHIDRFRGRDGGRLAN